MAKLACLGPFWVLILGLAPGISCISERSEALVMHLENDWVKPALGLEVPNILDLGRTHRGDWSENG